MARVWLGLAVVCVAAGAAWGYASGAPPTTCEDMTPQHGVEPQRGPFPYALTISKSKVKAGETVDVVIQGKQASNKFKGYMVQARVGNQPVGKFSGGNVIDCKGGAQNAATHSDPSEKGKVTVQWTAPPGLKEQVVFYVTVAKNGGEYWVAHKSRPLMVV